MRKQKYKQVWLILLEREQDTRLLQQILYFGFFKQISRFNQFDYTTSVAFSCFVLFVSKLNDKRNNFFYKMND